MARENGEIIPPKHDSPVQTVRGACVWALSADSVSKRYLAHVVELEVQVVEQRTQVCALVERKHPDLIPVHGYHGIVLQPLCPS
eukprot:2407756-Rhodomonas_salina.2